MRGSPLVRQMMAGWLLAVVALVTVTATEVANLWFADPDDAMRFNEVRDWIGGQGWFDVDQHRLWGGAFRMHWSRLVDVPIAGLMLLLRPLLGEPLANRAALVMVPMLTLLAIIVPATLLARRLAGREAAGLAPFLVPLSVPIVYQTRPLRIDHHGWQIALALGAVAVLLAGPRRSWRTGALAGAMLATLLTISLEGLPITAAIVGVTILAAAVSSPQRRNDGIVAEARALLLALLGATVALHVATRGPHIMLAACDAVSPVWIAALAVAVAGAVPALALRTPALRLAGLAVTCVAAGVTVALLAPDCLRGPFGALDPFVYEWWYRNVAEGLPAWEQDRAWATMMLVGPLIGLIGGVMAWRRAAGETRTRWTMLLAIAAAAFALSLLVMRTGSTANALAIPGCAVALDAALRRARAARPGPVRILATAAALLLVTPGLVAIVAIAAAEGPPPAGDSSGRPTCTRGREMAALARLPRATLFAPIDVSPFLLAWTPHRAVGAGYHRNPAAIRRVTEAFLASPDRARRLVLASGADYVVGCPGENETRRYVHLAPDGLWARLERGERIAWLEPVPTGSAALAWRVMPLRD